MVLTIIQVIAFGIACISLGISIAVIVLTK